ncbi:putative Kinase [Quillaja saponaria]|uniref:Kinase n=1 Tax=Quillaja saponaria TaxID=32244 RepID=A0AAD7LL53_QUISA|nr:putative Kinase [Quillaja saponaria]
MVSSCKTQLSSTSIAFLLLLLLPEPCNGTDNHPCPPSSCGDIHNISHPFRLSDNSANCGDIRYNLSCENNLTVLYIQYRKYYVQAINYNNYTIRVVDSGIQKDNCSSLPRYFLNDANFTPESPYSPFQIRSHSSDTDSIYGASSSIDPELSKAILYLNCSNSVNSLLHVDTAPCISGTYSLGHKWNFYVDVSNNATVSELTDSCRVELMSYLSWPWKKGEKVSYIDIHKQMVYGFELSWLKSSCNCTQLFSKCYLDIDSNQPSCTTDGHRPLLTRAWSIFRSYAQAFFTGVKYGLQPSYLTSTELGLDGPFDTIGLLTPRYIVVRFLLGISFFIVLLIYKWRRRHLSMYENIESFLEDNNSLSPIRYSYKEIKNMTSGFQIKLGEGGFGSVYKGKLRSGPFVAIKMLCMSKTNGEDFISEVATIGRIHHVNVVRLVGYCVEGSKRALVYEFMPNGSLDKYIFPKNESISLSFEKIYEISLGVACGINYLHQGCDMQILHFDIKPHNILLDENFVPKVSDFGLAKLYPVDDSIVSLTAARGTLGYMAPELFYKNIGGVSYKADVYSFGMLLMEMTSRRKNFVPGEVSSEENLSQLYFPIWIYNQFSEGNDIELVEDATKEEKNVANRMIIVALWCIQLKPSDRPSMKEVVNMLEGETESLEMPPKPFLYPHETPAPDNGLNSAQTSSSYWTEATSDYEEITTDPLSGNSS